MYAMKTMVPGTTVRLPAVCIALRAHRDCWCVERAPLMLRR